MTSRQRVRTWVLIFAAVSLGFTPWLSGCGDDSNTSSVDRPASERNVLYRGSTLIVFDDAPAAQVQSAGEQACGNRGYTLAFDNNYYGRIWLTCGPVVPDTTLEQP